MPRSLRIHATAANEAARAKQWYDSVRPGLGVEFESAINAALDILEMDPIPSVPAQGAAAGRGVRRIVLKRFPYDVVFVLRPGYVWVIAFAHHARRPGFWMRRLRT